MGVSQSNISQIFPSLNNFPSPFDESVNINFIKSS
jgi:hypothetical protein